MAPEFEDVVASEYLGLLRYATVLCGDPDQARDLVHSVLVRACEKWSRISRADQPGAYLVRMVTNEFLSWRRRWSTRSVFATDDATLHRVGRRVADHGELIAQREELETRLAALPRRQQAALVLRYFEDLEYPEIAAILGCAEGTVRAACSRGLATLRLDTSAEFTYLEAR